MRIGWCAYFLPFMFVYTPALVMNDRPLTIVLHLALSVLGILVATIAVVGHCFAPVSWPFRAAYAVIGLSLLVQPGMFDGAWWVIGTGAVLAIVAIGREWMRGRMQRASAA
jgi:TRAP-type uncharacterized transport system fused permease subunit